MEAQQVTIAVRVPEKTRRRLRVAAAASGETIQAIVRQALNDALDRKEGKRNERDKKPKRAPKRSHK